MTPSRPQEGPALEAVDVTRSYALEGGTVQALRGVSLTVEQGDYAAVVGPSGSGKSTLMHLLGGLDQPSGGSIDVGGERIDQLSSGALARWRAAHVGFVFQLYNLLPVLTAQRNVELPLLLTRLSAAERRTRAALALSVVGLRDRAKHYPRQLSGGQEQRVGIARALSLKPKLMVADEPTSALDVSVQAKVLELFQNLQRELGFACLFVTHDLAVVDVLADRICVMQRGRIVEQGTRDQILRNPQEPYTQKLLAAVPLPDPERQRERRELRAQLLAAGAE